MVETIKLIISFFSGGLAGAILNHYIAIQKNKIQHLCCFYTEDEIISKLPISFGDTTHGNLQAKKFIIKNTTNKDIDSIKIIFEFEKHAVVTKCVTYSKAGNNIPKGKISSNGNECSFVIKHFNRKETIDVHFEIGNIIKDIFSITEQNITGVKIKYLDKRKPTQTKQVKMVEKKALHSSI